jgi:hypothetical protein
MVARISKRIANTVTAGIPTIARLSNGWAAGQAAAPS